MLKSLILSLVLVSAVVAKVERPLFFGRHPPTASDPLHYVHSDIITGLTYDVKLNENVVKLDDILSILAISCKTEELVITTEDTTIAALWKSNTVLHGGREWQCTNAAGSTAAFTRRFVSVSVLDEETIAVKTSSAKVLDCFETASIRYNPRQHFSTSSSSSDFVVSRNENNLKKSSTVILSLVSPGPFTANEKIYYTVDLTNQQSLVGQTVDIYLYADIPYFPDKLMSTPQSVILTYVNSESWVYAPPPSLLQYYLYMEYNCLVDDTDCSTAQSANFYVPISSSFQLAGLVDVSIDCDNSESGNTFSCTDSVTVDSLAPTTSSFNPPVPALSGVDVSMSASMLLNVSSSTSFEVSSFNLGYGAEGVTSFDATLSFSTQTSISIDATLDFYAQYAKNFSLFSSNDVTAVSDLVAGGISIVVNPGLAIGIQLTATLETDLQISANHQTSSAATVTLTYNPSSNPSLSHTITPLSPNVESGSLSVLGTANVSIIVGVPVNFTLTFVDVFDFYGVLIPALEVDVDGSYPAFKPSTAATAGALIPALNFGVCQNNHYCEIQTFFGLDYAYGFSAQISLGGYNFDPISDASPAYPLFHSFLFGGCLFSPDATSGEESPVDFTLTLKSAFASQLQQAKSAASAVYAALVHDFNQLLASASSISSSSFQVQLTSLTGAVASFQIYVVAGSGLSVSKIAQALQTTIAFNTIEASSFVDTSQQVTLTSSSNPSTTTSFYLTQQGGSPSPTSQTHSAASSIGAGVNLLCLQAAMVALFWALM